MTLAEIIAEVYAITNRPDLVAETLGAVKAATLKAHRSDFYSKDIYETGVEFDTSEYYQSLDYITFIPNYRALKYFRRVEDANDRDGTFIQMITPEEMLDAYGDSHTDICYVAGRVIEIKSKVAFQHALMGCYVSPIVTEAGYASWVAEQHPYSIIYEACRVLFKMIGYDEQSASFAGLVAEEYGILRQTGLADVGY